MEWPNVHIISPQDIALLFKQTSITNEFWHFPDNLAGLDFDNVFPMGKGVSNNNQKHAFGQKNK